MVPVGRPSGRGPGDPLKLMRLFGSTAQTVMRSVGAA